VKTGKERTWFFDCDETGSFKNKERYHSIISELYYAVQRARIVVNYDKKNNLVAIWANKDKSTTKQCKKGETAQEVDKNFEGIHLETLLKQKWRGKSFCALGIRKWKTFLWEPQKHSMQTA
jgi:hypothetical protein